MQRENLKLWDQNMTVKKETIINVVYYLLTAVLIVILGISVLMHNMQILTDYAFNFIFIPWLIILVVKFKRYNDERRTRKSNYVKQVNRRIIILHRSQKDDK